MVPPQDLSASAMCLSCLRAQLLGFAVPDAQLVYLVVSDEEGRSFFSRAVT